MPPTPALMKYTFGFRDLQAGWSESWYSSTLDNRTTARGNMTGYMRARLALCGVGIWGATAKAAALDGSGVSYKIYPNLYTTVNGQAPLDVDAVTIQGAQGVTAAAPGNPDRPYSTLLVTFQATTGQKAIFLSGIPDGVITDPFGPAFLGNYQAALNAWQDVINGFKWGWNSRRSGGSYPKSPILLITAGASPTIVAPSSAVTPGTLVQVGGLRGTRGYRGQFYVQTNTGGTLVLQGYAPPATLTNPRGYVQQVGVGFVQCPDNTPNFQETHHNRGKGPALLVGRRKARHN